MTSAYKYPARYNDEIRIKDGNVLRPAVNATFTIYQANTTTPATIYADDQWTIANGSGSVTTDAEGNYSVLLDPAFQYYVSYKGANYPVFSVGDDSRESVADLADHAALTGSTHGLGSSETFASQQWVTSNFTTGGGGGGGGTTAPATSTTLGTVQLAGDLGGTATAPTVPKMRSTDNPITTADLDTTVQHNLTLASTAVQSSAAVTGVSTDNGATYQHGNVIIGTGGTSVGDATASAKGIVQLAGALGGTAASPTVPGLANKVDNTDARLTNARTPTAHAASHATGGTDPITFPAQTATGTTFSAITGVAASNVQAAISAVQNNVNAANTAAGTAQTTANSKYLRPSGGVPRTDLDASSQASLTKADTALQTAPVSSVNGATGAVTGLAKVIESVNTASVSGAVTIPDVTTATMHKYTLTGNTTFTMPTAAPGKTIAVQVVQDATGSRTGTFTGVKWSNFVVPTLSTGGNNVDVFTFMSFATTWYGFTAGQAMR